MDDANKHVLPDEREQMHVRTNNGVRLRKRGCGGREEERTQTTHICKVSPPRHAYPLMTYVNRATARVVSGSGDDDTVVATPVAPSQPYQRSTTRDRTGPNPCCSNCRRDRPCQYSYRLPPYLYCTVWLFLAVYWVK